ncbi:ATP-binding protein [Actinacidiphila oryziradicis]|uniref:ATP-binding protein n=1 Tax=Actinacidiphila oryziradicis TaxID=2571141 RepID=A0A4U0SNK4_9ACTN|nr:ATP-binding protein [Actinacidiphila oryziradicis]TKA11564.1 ATP-binding protein [Actinacidiphila oryziradicis]
MTVNIQEHFALDYQLTAPNDASAPKVARELLAAILATADRAGMVDAAQVCVSDVVTNVLRHTRVAVLAVEVSVLRDRVIVGVRDSDPEGRPCVRPPSAEREGGRGLLLVRTLAHRWGVTWTGGVTPTGKRVWFELREGCAGGCTHSAGVPGW